MRLFVDRQRVLGSEHPITVSAFECSMSICLGATLFMLVEFLGGLEGPGALAAFQVSP